jgi:hypothetical protein
MFKSTFYHQTIRKYIVHFGNLFNDIYINREENGEVIQTLRIPLVYGPKEKYLGRAEGDPELSDPLIGVPMPSMSFELVNINYDPERKLNKINRICSPDGKSYQYMPVPYNFTFKLSVMAKNAEDATSIIEQIIPYFAPDWTATLNLVANPPIALDIPLILETVGVEADSYRGPFEIRRVIIWELNFLLKGFLFGPTKTSTLIKNIDINLFDSVNLEREPQTSINIKPGLTVEGEPTSNASLSIDYLDIQPSDNYGFIKTFEKG